MTVSLRDIQHSEVVGAIEQEKTNKLPKFMEGIAEGPTLQIVVDIGKPKPRKENRKKMVKSPILPPKPSKPKRKKKTTRQKLIKALDTIVREIVFMRDTQAAPLVYRVVTEDEETGEEKVEIVPVMNTTVDHPGHIISRARMSVRWDLRNVHRQNAAHNLLHEYYPEVYNQWFINMFGLEAWNELVNDSKQVSTYSTAQLETLLFNLTEVQKANYLRYYPQKLMVDENFCQKFGLGSVGTLSHLERTTV